MYNSEKVKEIKKIISVLDNILEKDDFAIFGSGPMYIRDLRDKIKDLDLIVNQKGWNKLIQHYKSKKTNSGFGSVIIIKGEKEIEIFDMWGPGKWDLDELIKTSDKIEEVNFVTLENVLKWKKEMNREKDVEDIKKINEFLI
jgi:predicted nucleotidyltransferase